MYPTLHALAEVYLQCITLKSEFWFGLNGCTYCGLLIVTIQTPVIFI